MEVERVEAQTVIDHDQTAWKEEIGHEGHAAVVDGHHRCPTISSEIDARVRRLWLAVDHTSRPEARPGLGAPDRPGKAPPPESLRRDRPVQGPELVRFRCHPPLGVRVDIDHLLGQREALNREVSVVDLETSLDRLRWVAWRHDGHPPGLDARLRLDVDTDQRGATAGLGKERQWPAAERALEDGALGNAADLHPHDVADAYVGRMPADLYLGVRGHWPGEDDQLSRGGEERGGQEEAGPPQLHSGRCCRRNCSISATSSEAGGKSLVPAAAGGWSSTSLASSLVT